MAVNPGVNWAIRVRIGCFSYNQAAINTVHFQVEALTGTVSLDDIASHFDTALAPLYKAAMTDKALYYGTAVQGALTDEWTVQAISDDFTGQGTAGSTPLPLQTCGLISSKTDYAGRAYQGRVFIPFPDQEDSDPLTNTPLALYLGKLAAIAPILYETQLVTVGANSITLEPKVGAQVGLAQKDITSWRVRDKWATQRRRGNYGAANVYPPF